MKIIRIVLGIAAALVCTAAILFVFYRPQSLSQDLTNEVLRQAQDRNISSPEPVQQTPGELRSSEVEYTQIYPSIDTVRFLDLPRFFAVANLQVPTSTAKGRVVAGVVNHHVLAADLLERFAKGLRAARSDVKRIIILSPDHFHAGRSAISTHLRSYQTPLGKVEVDREAIAHLIENGVAVDNGPMFEQEHGVGALIPFLHRSFADMQIVPVAIRGEADDATLMSLAHTLEPLLDRQTIIVVSADMSHYLTEDVALKNDVQTLKWLQTLDGQAFDAATDDFVDNGSSFVVLSHIFEQRDQKLTFTLLDHTISSRYAGSRDNTTSYLTGIWSVPK